MGPSSYMRSVVNRNVVMRSIPVDGVIYHRKLAKNSHMNLASHLTDTLLYRHVVTASVIARKIVACNSSLNRLLFLAVPYNTRYITPNNQESRGIYCNWTRPCGSYIHIIPNTNLPNINLSTTLLHILVGPSSGSLPTHFPVQILHASRITPCKLYSHPIEAQLKQNKIPLGVSGTVIRHGSGFMHLWGF